MLSLGERREVEGEKGGGRGREGGRERKESGEREHECICAYLVLLRSRESRTQTEKVG